MSVKTPIKATFTGSDVTGLAEYQAADFIGVADGGTGATTFTAGVLIADGVNAFSTVSAPTGAIVGTSDTQTLTNKTINSASNTITITESNISDLQSYILADSTDTLTNKTISGSSNTLSNIGNSSLTNSSITVTDGTTSTATSLGGTITFAGTSNEIEVGESSGTITIGLPSDVTIGNNLTVSGDLIVSGTTTTINSSTIEITNSFTFEGSTADAYETVLGVVDPTADRTINLPNASGTIVLQDTTDTLTNKTINSASNTITITESNISDLQSYILAGSTDTLTNKSISLTSNTLTGTTAEFNTALSDGSFATLAGTETLTNKTIDADNNTISNIGDSELSSGISATKIADGSISNTEFQYLNGVTSNIQTQLNTKASTAFAIAQAVALG